MRDADPAPSAGNGTDADGSAVIPALRWIPPLVELVNQLCGGDIVEAGIEPTEDPLHWLLFLRSTFVWNSAKTQPIRQIIEWWAATNNAHIHRARIQNNYVYGVEILIESTNTLQNFAPTSDEARSNQSTLASFIRSKRR